MADLNTVRNVLTELIDLYKDFPCLWDLSSENFKNNSQKKLAWEILTDKYKEIDPSANTASVKKKIDNLKASYQREQKKVKESKNRTGSAASDVHKPNLWYYELMTFLDKKNEANRTGVDSLISEDEDESQKELPKKRKSSDLDLKKEKLFETAQRFLTTEQSAFGNYVDKKIEEIPPGNQRDLAEKLILEILFLAKTNSLTFNTKIVVPSPSTHISLPHYKSHSFHPLQFSQPVPSHAFQSPSYIQSPVPLSHSSHSYQIAPPATSPALKIPVYIPSPLSSSDSSHSYQIAPPATSPALKIPVYIPSPLSSSDSSHSYQIAPPATSPALKIPVYIPSPLPSSDSSHSFHIAHSSTSPPPSTGSSNCNQIPHPTTLPTSESSFHMQSPPPSSGLACFQIPHPASSSISHASTHIQSSPSSTDSSNSNQIPHPTTLPTSESSFHMQSPPPSSGLASFQIPHPASSSISHASTHMQSSPPPSDSFNYQISHPGTPLPTLHIPDPINIQSPRSSSHNQLLCSSLAPPDQVQSPPPSENLVYYTEGPASDILKQMLIFKK